MKRSPSVQRKEPGVSDENVRVFLDGSERRAARVGGAWIGYGVYKPGWRWSEHVRPMLGKDSAEHTGYVISGRMRVRGFDGVEIEAQAGDAFHAAPGHDAWVIGDEPCVALDFASV
jgi:hypothetical protein